MDIKEKPIWKENLEPESFPKLEQDLESEVVIVGGGLAGVLSAYLLAKEGKKVVILEKKKIGSGATEYTTAFITQVVDTHLEDLIKLFGEDKAGLVWRSGADAIELIEKIVNEENIDCEFKRVSAFIYANDAKQYDLVREMSATARRLGFDVSNILHDTALKFANIGYIEVKNQAKFHPLKFLHGLANKIQKMGVQIYEQSEVTDVDHEQERVIIKTADYKIVGKKVIIATYQPFNNRVRMFLKRGMYRSYVLGLKLQKSLLKEGLYFDVANPYHYFRVDSKETYDEMILGGEDSKTIFKIDPEKSYNALKSHLNQILGKNQYEVTHKWIGQILEPSDGLPLIGETREHEYIASAFSGNGMTYSAVSAMIFADLLAGRENIYSKVYDPQRIPSIKQLYLKGTDYVEEFLGGVAKNVFRSPDESEVS